MAMSTPHISFLYNGSTLIEAGMWLLKKFKKGDALKQLTMADENNMSECLLYKLSTSPGLDWFKHIVLFGSPQDTYCPLDSALIQVSKQIENDSYEKGIVYKGMVDNIFSKIKIPRIHRVSITFNMATKNFDTFLGRAAHIQYLENEILIKILVNRFEEFFV